MGGMAEREETFLSRQREGSIPSMTLNPDATSKPKMADLGAVGIGQVKMGGMP